MSAVILQPRSTLESLRDTPDLIENLLKSVLAACLPNARDQLWRMGATEQAIGLRLRRLEPPRTTPLDQVVPPREEWPLFALHFGLERFRRLRAWNLALFAELGAESARHPSLELMLEHDRKCIAMFTSWLNSDAD